MKYLAKLRTIALLLLLFFGGVNLYGQATSSTFKIDTKVCKQSWFLDVQTIDGEMYLLKWVGEFDHYMQREGIYFAKLDSENELTEEAIVFDNRAKDEGKKTFTQKLANLKIDAKIDFLGFHNNKWYFFITKIKTTNKPYSIEYYLGTIDTDGEFSKIPLGEMVQGKKNLVVPRLPNISASFGESSFVVSAYLLSAEVNLFQFSYQGELLNQHVFDLTGFKVPLIKNLQCYIDSKNNLYAAVQTFMTTENKSTPHDGKVIYYSVIDGKEHRTFIEFDQLAAYRSSFYEEDGTVYCLELISGVKKPEKEKSANLYSFHPQGIKLERELFGEFEAKDVLISDINAIDLKGNRLFLATFKNGYQNSNLILNNSVGWTNLIQLSDNSELKVIPIESYSLLRNYNDNNETEGIISFYDGRAFVFYCSFTAKDQTKRSVEKPDLANELTPFIIKFDSNLELIEDKAITYNGKTISGRIVRVENSKLILVYDTFEGTTFYTFPLSEL